MTLVPAFEIGVWNAWIFMSVFILQMLAVVFLGKRVWERSNHPSDVERNKSEAINSIIGNAIWLLATIYSIFLPLQLGTIWFYIGLPIFLIGLIILVVATVYFAIAPMDRPITKGPYKLSRHPLYLSLLIVYIGTSIATASWVFLLLCLANVFWIRLESIVEERCCLEQYGNDYQEYIDRIPRWLGVHKY